MSFSKSLPELNMPIKYSYTVVVLFVKWLRIETTGMFLRYQGSSIWILDRRRMQEWDNNYNKDNTGRKARPK